MKEKKTWMCVIICLVSISALFILYSNKKGDALGEKESSVRTISTWTVYWDSKNVLEDMKEIGSVVSSLSYFAAYFDSNQSPFIPENTVNTYAAIELAYSDTNYKSYLTFVNDVLQSEGGASLKDTKLLYSLLSTRVDRENHINEIIAMTQNGGYDGIEIDYEGIKKDEELLRLFIKFIDELYVAATKKELLIRVLLEPNSIIEKFTLPGGPEYVMMCYNLYGYGTKPGPKANKDFLISMVEKMSRIPGKKGFAVANGGFDFHESGSVEQISTKDAIKKQELYHVSSYRDNESGCVVYKYQDELGGSHEVWYADNTTIDYWFDVLEEIGEENLFLWRIGG